MSKKFVKLHSPDSPSTNPYEIRTFQGNEPHEREWFNQECVRADSECTSSAYLTAKKTLTNEEELKHVQKVAAYKINDLKCRKKYQLNKKIEQCVPQRSPHELKTHIVFRERYLQIKNEITKRKHNALENIRKPCPSLIRLNSAMDLQYESDDSNQEEEEEEENVKKIVKLRYESPSCSSNVFYIPPKKLLELKRPKSGMFHNETEQPCLSNENIMYSEYNPRLLQKKFNDQGLQRIDIIDGQSPLDMWTWNLGLQRSSSLLQRYILDDNLTTCDFTYLGSFVFLNPKEIELTYKNTVVYGKSAIPPSPKPRKPHSITYYHRPSEVGCLLAAYVQSFRLNPDFWTVHTLDNILKMGCELVDKSVKLNYKSDDDSGFDIVKILEKQKASVGLRPFIIGLLQTESLIFKALTLYFSRYPACILIADDLYLLIWKCCSEKYYVYDPNGRNQKCRRDHRRGLSSLMCVSYMEHLVNLIVHTNRMKPDQQFSIYYIYLIHFDKLLHTLPKIPYPKRFRKVWIAVNENYAVIPSSNLGIHQPISSKSVNASLTISLMALLYGHIESAQDWSPGVLDDLHRYGTWRHKRTLKQLGLVKRVNHKTKYLPLNMNDLPDTLMISGFKIKLRTYPFFETGHINPCRYFKDSLLTYALRNVFFNNGMQSQWNGALLQIDNSAFAIWRDVKLFYMFDPFRRNSAGQVLDPENHKKIGASCLQMHTCFNSLCRIIYMKALKLRRGGIFFLHAVHIISIRPVRQKSKDETFYYNLKLECVDNFESEEVCEEVMEEIEEEEDWFGEEKEIDKKTIKKMRVYPTLSLHTIPESDLIPSYDSIDVVIVVLDEILCDILNIICSSSKKVKAGYKQASKVLLHSDKNYLNILKYKLQHGEDFDNILQEHKLENVKSPGISFEQELLLPSNFQKLPDDSWVVFGNIELPIIDDEKLKLSALLSCLTALCLSTKYNISTWSSEVVDFAVESVNQFGEQFKSFYDALSAILNEKLPDICIGDNCFCIGYQKLIRSGAMHSLRQVLLECLFHYNKFLIVCPHFSCIIVKRYNFLYMFASFPCNQVGYRQFSPGPACLLRSTELDSLIRRIEYACNPEGCDVGNYIIICVKVSDITYEDFDRFRNPNDKEQSLMYAEARNDNKILLNERNSKLRFLNSEIHKENKRISKFKAEKKAHEQRTAKTTKGYCKKIRGFAGAKIKARKHADHYNEEVLEENEEDIDTAHNRQHKPGTILASEDIQKFQPPPTIYGYRRRIRDGLFKIQGTKALEERELSSSSNIKPCFFASSIAVIYSVIRPLHQWTSQRVDYVIDEAKRIASKLSSTKSTISRTIKNINVDDYTFDIRVDALDKKYLRQLSAKENIEHLMKSQNFLLLQLPNCTFAIYHDIYYHLFDPYHSMEMIHPDTEEGDEEAEDLAFSYEGDEKNTASWVLFANIDCMLEYIDKRATNSDWQYTMEYQLHSILIVNYKKAAQKLRILKFLTDPSMPMVCSDSNREENVTSICVQYESMSWLEDEKTLPLWSRLIRRNASGKYRNLPVTKFKKFDVEIEGQLWSIWGNLHPMAPCFDKKSRGKQYLACNVVACCAASMYRLTDWSPELLDDIIIYGDKYHRASMAQIEESDYEFSLEDLNLECELEHLKFDVHLEHVAFGRLYCIPNSKRMNLAEGLMYFFKHFKFGILQVRSRSLAIGRVAGHDGGYFMFDCQSYGAPLFKSGQGAAYLLRTLHLQILLYCIVMSLHIPYYNVQYTLHKVDLIRDGAQIEKNNKRQTH